MKDNGWYEKKIEPEVRELVRLLRNNGVNTTCSCGHEMFIEASYIPDESIMETYRLICNHLHENHIPRRFRAKWEVTVIDGSPFWHIEIDLNPEI
jgi:hypothetical protein